MSKLAPNRADRPDRESATRSDDLIEVRLWLRLLTCTNLIEREVRARLGRDFDITLSRFDVLAQLARADDGLTMGVLSRHMMVTHGNVTGLVDRLVKDGLVDRHPVAGNRRAVKVRLTRRGRAEFRRLAKAHNGWVRAMLGHMDRRTIKRTFDLLEHVKNSVLGELEPQPTTPRGKGN